MTLPDDTQRRGLIADLTRRLALAGHDELRVIDALLVRLELGRERYGLLDLERDRRDWFKERREELLDAMVYDVAEQLRADDLARANLRNAAHAEMLGGDPMSDEPAALMARFDLGGEAG